jgi:hypothetical protein
MGENVRLSGGSCEALSEGHFMAGGVKRIMEGASLLCEIAFAPLLAVN